MLKRQFYKQAYLEIKFRKHRNELLRPSGKVTCPQTSSIHLVEREVRFLRAVL